MIESIGYRKKTTIKVSQRTRVNIPGPFLSNQVRRDPEDNNCDINTFRILHHGKNFVYE